HYTLVLKDTTRGWSHTVHKTLRGAANSSAEVIAEAPSSSGGILPLTNFGTVHFSQAAVNGAAMGRANPTKIIMVNDSGRAKDSVSALTGGTAFSAKGLPSTYVADRRCPGRHPSRLSRTSHAKRSPSCPVVMVQGAGTSDECAACQRPVLRLGVEGQAAADLVDRVARAVDGDPGQHQRLRGHGAHGGPVGVSIGGGRA